MVDGCASLTMALEYGACHKATKIQALLIIEARICNTFSVHYQHGDESNKSILRLFNNCI